MDIHYELLGTIPSVECYRFELDNLMRRYEDGRADVKIPQLGLMTGTERTEYIEQIFKNPEALNRMAQGVTIELCAQHFYGLKGEDFGSIGDLIDAIRGMDDDLEARA